MGKFLDLLDRLKRDRKIGSDNQAAKLLGISRQALCSYRKGHHIPDDYALTRLALELGMDPLALIAEVRAETEPNKEKRAFWRDFFRRVGRRALILPLICGVFWWAGSESQTANANDLTRNNIIRVQVWSNPYSERPNIKFITSRHDVIGIIDA